MARGNQRDARREQKQREIEKSKVCFHFAIEPSRNFDSCSFTDFDDDIETCEHHAWNGIPTEAGKRCGKNARKTETWYSPLHSLWTLFGTLVLDAVLTVC